MEKGNLHDYAGSIESGIRFTYEEENSGIELNISQSDYLFSIEDWPLKDGTETAYRLYNWNFGFKTWYAFFHRGPVFTLGIDSQGSPSIAAEYSRGNIAYCIGLTHFRHHHDISIQYNDSQNFDVTFSGENTAVEAQIRGSWGYISYLQSIYSRFSSKSPDWDPDIRYNLYSFSFLLGKKYSLQGSFDVRELNGTLFYNNSSYVFLGQNTGISSTLAYRQIILPGITAGVHIYHASAVFDEDLRIDSTPFHPSAGLYPIRWKDPGWSPGMLWAAISGEYKLERISFGFQWNQQIFTTAFSYRQRVWDVYPLVSHYETNTIENPIGSTIIGLSVNAKIRESLELAISQAIPFSITGSSLQNPNTGGGSSDSFEYGGLSVSLLLSL